MKNPQYFLGHYWSENPFGYVYLGWVYEQDYWLGNTKSPQETIQKGVDLAQKALAMDDSIGGVHSLLCWLYLFKREYDKAIAEAEQAVALSPGALVPLEAYGATLRYIGKSKEAVPFFQKAVRLNPLGSSSFHLNFANALRDAGRSEEAISAYKKSIQLAPDNILTRIGLAATYSMIGREKEARAEAAEVLRINPNFLLASYAKSVPYKDQSQKDKVLDALRKAGLK